MQLLAIAIASFSIVCGLSAPVRSAAIAEASASAFLDIIRVIGGGDEVGQGGEANIIFSEEFAVGSAIASADGRADFSPDDFMAVLLQSADVSSTTSSMPSTGGLARASLLTQGRFIIGNPDVEPALVSAFFAWSVSAEATVTNTEAERASSFAQVSFFDTLDFAVRERADTTIDDLGDTRSGGFDFMFFLSSHEVKEFFLTVEAHSKVEAEAPAPPTILLLISGIVGFGLISLRYHKLPL
jgi:hypothetical protein